MSETGARETQGSESGDRSRELLDSLDTSLDLIRRLEEKMLDETRAIESRQPEALRSIVSEKLDLVSSLEAETGRQKALVEGGDCSFTPDGIESFIAGLDQGDAALERWLKMRAAIARCDRLNKANARLIERDRKRIALSLRILSGESGGTACYDPHGRPEADRPQGKTFTRA